MYNFVTNNFQFKRNRHAQNHGNLTVLVHPLTKYDLEDHLGRKSWIGDPVVLDAECKFLSLASSLLFVNR